jgi:DNA helicase-2/ATP-dependent DNA helicase PcrA
MNTIRLSNEQNKSAKHFSGPALTLAVPGSGKTTLLMVRTMNLINNHGIAPENILTMTFSKASAEDMKRRFQHLYPDYRGILPPFMTIHSFCYNILKQYQKKNSLSLKLIDSSNHSKFALLKDIVADLSGELISDEALEQLINEIGYVKNMMLSKEDFKDHTTHKSFDAIYARYEAYKKKHQLIDFDDMLTMTYNILKNSGPALKFLQDKYPHIQVDEAQDTSNIQFELLKLLGGASPNIFMVADDDQSIYAFRGANPQNLLEFQKHFGTSQLYYLTNNYRSTPSICSISNAFINQNESRYVKSMVPYNTSTDHLPVSIKTFDDLTSRNHYLLDFIENSKDQDKNIGILFRNNSSSIGLSYLLYKNGIEFYIKDKAISFFNHFVVQDILNFMHLALASNDLMAFERISQRTGTFIPFSAIEYVRAYNRGRNVFDTLLECKDISKQSHKYISTYKDALVTIQSATGLTAIRTIEKDLGYLQRIEKISSKYDTKSDSIKRVLTQLKIIGRNTHSITEFMEELNQFKNVLLSGTNHYNSKVNFSTYHSSKGLEYDTVFIIDPLEKDPNQQTDLLEEEERRLFYVAMTRAKTSLNIMYHKFEEGAYLKEISYLQFLKAQDPSAIKVEQHIVETKAVDCTIKVGAAIHHSKFGCGYLCDLKGDTMTIEFPDKVRQLSYALCKEKGLL